MKLSNGKIALAILAAIMIMVVTQLASQLMLNLVYLLALPSALGYALAGITYTLLGYYLLTLFAAKALKVELRELMIPPVGFKPLWVVVSVLLPLTVSAVFLLLPGQWSRGSQADEAAVIASAVFFVGISAGVVEEVLFRGMMMSLLQKRWNTVVAVVVPSVIFAVLHVVGRDLDFVSFLMLLLAGTTVGIMFSLITLQSCNVWNSALVHTVWNAVIIGWVLHISDVPDEGAIFNYTIASKSRFLTGGDFGIEASVIALGAYLAVICLAAVLIHRARKK